MIKLSKYIVKLKPFSVIVFISVIVYIFVGAYRLSLGDGGQLKINDQLEISINASTNKKINSIPLSGTVKSDGRDFSKRDIIEPYYWDVDSYWVTDMSAEKFCLAQKRAREYQNSKVFSVLLRTNVETKEEYIPSKIVYYRYKCIFKDRLIK